MAVSGIGVLLGRFAPSATNMTVQGSYQSYNPQYPDEVKMELKTFEEEV